MRHYSTTVMAERLVGLLGTDDLTEWEQQFVTSIERRLKAGEMTQLTERQGETLDSLHNKHFA